MELHGAGYFTSRPAAKGYIRSSSAYLQAARQLEVLTENLGLSTVQIPDDGSLTDADHQFLKHLVHLQALKRTLWNTVQSYQDEARPVKESSSRGGSTRRLDTTKLAATNKAMKSKATHVTTAVSKFNSVVEQLEKHSKPEFIPEGLIPRRLEVKELLHLDPGSPVWDEVFGGTPWIQDWNNPASSTPIPEYAKSKTIREGILAALKLERAKEEECRLNMEKVNGLNVWVHEICRT